MLQASFEASDRDGLFLSDADIAMPTVSDG
jgi:hypothetical protein